MNTIGGVRYLMMGVAMAGMIAGGSQAAIADTPKTGVANEFAESVCEGSERSLLVIRKLQTRITEAVKALAEGKREIEGLDGTRFDAEDLLLKTPIQISFDTGDEGNLKALKAIPLNAAEIEATNDIRFAVGLINAFDLGGDRIVQILQDRTQMRAEMKPTEEITSKELKAMNDSIDRCTIEAFGATGPKGIGSFQDAPKTSDGLKIVRDELAQLREARK